MPWGPPLLSFPQLVLLIHPACSRVACLMLPLRASDLVARLLSLLLPPLLLLLRPRWSCWLLRPSTGLLGRSFLPWCQFVALRRAKGNSYALPCDVHLQDAHLRWAVGRRIGGGRAHQVV